MPLTNKQKTQIKRYQRFAALDDFSYRALLVTFSGCNSTTDPRMINAHFDAIMPALEALADARAERGEWQPDRCTVDLEYWRMRQPATGAANSRHIHAIKELWCELVAFLPPEKQTDDYLRSLIGHACNRRQVQWHTLTAWQAGMAIEALRDRLRAALRRRVA